MALGISQGLGFSVQGLGIEYGFGHIIIRSPYTPYSIPYTTHYGSFYFCFPLSPYNPNITPIIYIYICIYPIFYLLNADYAVISARGYRMEKVVGPPKGCVCVYIYIHRGNVRMMETKMATTIP